MLDFNPYDLAEKEITASQVKDLNVAGIDYQSYYPWPLNAEQLDAVKKLVAFLTDPNPSQKIFNLVGSAGTGKTSLMEGINKIFAESSAKIVYTAPTNKAAKVLKARVGQACTIYSLLGLRLEATGEVKVLTDAHSDIDLSDVNAVVVDESSMINSVLKAQIEKAIKKHDVRVIFMGDDCQIPPVGEAESPVFKMPIDAKLVKVERHDNSILNLAVHVRDQVNSPVTNIQTKTSADGDGLGVFKMDKMSFNKAIIEAARSGNFHKFDKCKIVAWTNREIVEYNEIVRAGFFGGISHKSLYLKDDKIVANAPVVRGTESLMQNGDEAIVLDAFETVNILAPEYKAIELLVLTEDDQTVRLSVVHPDSMSKWQADCNLLASQAKAHPSRAAWKKFWDLKAGVFDDITHAYASTAHKAQGSTYETCFVDQSSILRNRNRREALQCLYVAVSRASKALYIK